MSEISLDILTDGITLALRKAFPESYIAAGPVKQGLKTAAFIVNRLLVSQMSNAAGYRRFTVPFDIIYFPRASEENLNPIIERLNKILFVVDLPSGDKIRGSDMSAHVEEGLLHYGVTYNYRGTDKVRDNEMEKLKII